MTRETHPKGFKYIFFGELAERASYYGVSGLLVKYLIDQMGYTEATAGPVKHVWTAFCYLLPILGGLLADRFGKFKTIIAWSIPYLCGHLVLGGWDTEPGMFIALTLLAIGTGVTKPNVTPLMGLMYDTEGKSKQLRAKAFTWFYSSINIGAATTMWTLPWVRDNYSYRTAFFAPMVLMAVALLIFYLGKKHYPVENVQQLKKAETPAEKKEKWQILWGLSGVYTILIFFWSIYDQTGSTWIFLAEKMERYGLAADALQGFNPLLIVGMSPLFAWIWDWAQKKRGGRAFSYTEKMQFGFYMVTTCMGVMAFAGYLVEHSSPEDPVSAIWEMAAYILITTSEICISVVGLEMAYDLSPPRLKSTVTGAFLVTVFAGDLLAGVFSHYYPALGPAKYFLLMTVLMIIMTVTFIGVGRRFEQRQLAAKEAAPKEA